MVGEYKDYLERMCGFLVQSKVSEAVKLSREIETNHEQAGYLIETIYWYYSQLDRAQTGSRLLELPFTIGKNTEEEMRSAIKAEYLLYKHNIEPLYDWSVVQEAEDFELPETQEEEVESLVEEEAEEEEEAETLVEEEEAEEAIPVELDFSKDEICDIPDEVLESNEEDEPVSPLGVSQEDVCIEQNPAFDFLSEQDEEDECSNSNGEGYYSSLFSDTTDFRRPTMEEILRSHRNVIPKHDTEMMQTEYKREAMFREKMYTWYEKLESIVKFEW